MAAHAGGRYYCDTIEMGWCEALARVERAAAHRATSWESVGEGEAAGGRESAVGAGLLRDVCSKEGMNLSRRYYHMNSFNLVAGGGSRQAEAWRARGVLCVIAWGQAAGGAPRAPPGQSAVSPPRSTGAGGEREEAKESEQLHVQVFMCM